MIYAMLKEIFYCNTLHAFSSNIWYCKELIKVNSDIDLNHETKSKS